MLPSYADIRALTDAEPVWYGDNGVPRYAPFHPRLLGVYDKIAVLAEIKCQSCAALLLVGRGTPLHTFHVPLGQIEVVQHSLEKLARGFVFGDPPRHGCPGAGETMGCIERRIVEAWERVDLGWVRRPEHEIAL
ncbi:MAG: hypothetical protein ACYCU6_12290, partial [Acidimicrobiales bacterium]